MSPPAVPSRGRVSLLVLCLFLSGAAALVYEVAWIRRASLVFGSTTFAVGTVLAVFFLGLGIGSHLFGKRSLRLRRPLSTFAALELAIAVLAALSPLAFELVDAAYGSVWAATRGRPVLSVAARLGFVSAVLLPPTILMGASLPLYVRHFLQAEDRFGRSIGRLYAVNTLGGAAGAAAAGFGLIPVLGLNGAIWTGALLDAVAGAVVLALRVPALPEPPERPGPESEPRRIGAVVGLLFSVSFVALGIEVLWSRHLSLLLRNSVHTYTLTLTVVLVGIVIGSLAVAPRLDRLENRARVFGRLQFLTGLSILVLMALSPGVWRELGHELETCFLLFLPTAILSGASFPLAVRMVVSEARLGSLGTGRMAAVSSVGGVSGSLLAGMVLLPQLGLATSSLVLAGVSMATAFACRVFLDREQAFARRAFAGTTAIAVWAAVPLASPTRVPADFLAERGALVDFREGYGADLAVVRGDGDELRLEIDRWWQGTDRKNHQIFAAHLPMLLHPDPRSVLVVGAGTGQTASRFLLHDPERLECVDIEPTIFDFVARHFDSAWMRDERVTLVPEDGRTYVRYGRSSYDVMSLEVGQIFRPGVAFFYTRDFYRDARARLAPGGILVQFVPLAFLDEALLRGILRTFREVFPQCALWYNTGELLLLGTTAERFAIGSGTLERLAAKGPVHDDLRYGHWGGAEGWLNHRDVFLSGFLAGPRELEELGATGEVYTDDRPVLDYATQSVDQVQAGELPLVELIGEHLGALEEVLDGDLGDGELEAIAALRRLDLGQITAAALVRRAEALRARGNHRDAIPILERAVAANGKHFSSRLLLGDSLMFRGEVERAAENFAEAARIRPDSGRAHFGLAVAHFQLGRLPEAAIEFRLALDARPDDAQSHNGLGAVLTRLGDLRGAREHFEEALRLRPDFADARANLQRLDAREKAPR